MPDPGPIRLDLKAESEALYAARERMMEIAASHLPPTGASSGPVAEAAVEAISVEGAPSVIRASLDVARAAVDRLEAIAHQYPPCSPERRAMALYLKTLLLASEGLVRPFADLARWHKAQNAGKPGAN